LCSDAFTEEQHRVIDAAQAYIDELFSGESSGHDGQHSLRVWRTAMRINRGEHGDAFVTALAALLHDADDHKLFDTAGTLAHARGFMAEQGVDQATAERVCEVIRGVGFKGGHNAPPTSLEGRVVQDADRLDAIGAIGIGRAFAYGGAKGRAMYMPGETPQSFRSAEEYAASQGTTVNHFYEKLLLLRDRMHTNAARKLAEERHRFMEEFLREFYDEWDGRK